jgi:hypothetical protein
VLGEYLRALANSMFINRSREAIEECRQYVYLPNNHVENQYARGITDGATGGRNHGDRVVADALANKALGPEPSLLAEQQQQENPYGLPEADQFWVTKDGKRLPYKRPPEHTFAGRFRQWQDSENPRPGKEWESSPEALRGWESSREALEGW